MAMDFRNLPTKPTPAGGGTIRRVGPPPAPPSGDWSKALDVIALKIISRSKFRAKKGQDADGQPFVPYSPAYSNALRRGGENGNKVDLWVTGSLMGSLHVKKKRVHPKGGGYVVVGPSSGHGQNYYFADGARKWSGVGRRLKDGKRGPPGEKVASLSHAQIGYLHQHGIGRLPKRKWLGLTAKETQSLTKELRAMGLVGFRLSGHAGRNSLFKRP